MSTCESSGFTNYKQGSQSCLPETSGTECTRPGYEVYGRGKMMGVDHNRDLEWIGASAAFFKG